ncbi:hypothetical protein MAC_09207 [Metarhizium acridum CQMa 102]|uniref:Uncharacterized protein n=1 Tax=Metarhizium acridum (strain CQMa 102) TaxID=655827 RepID=E9EH59_METAQ|nr:uncharacterized protein MAC_09207 [Metarhizium acridum CQMa 102]EFY84763.1 hypothetical protein MAC_09207 [Metarhizium acridum CQMa 102]
MKSSHFLPFIAALAASVTASPIQEAADEQISPRGSPASACFPFADPHCHVPTVCQCANGWIYEYNRDNYNAGGNGCDPPWRFIGKKTSQHPKFRC